MTLANQRKIRDLESVLSHLDMLLYGWEASGWAEISSRISAIPRLYHMFAGAHLITTMFLVDRKKSPMGGAVFRILSRNGLGHLLQDILAIIDSPIGKTSFGDIIRHNRNRLMTHGELSFGTLPSAVRAVPRSRKQAQRFAELMQEFIDEVRVLRQEIQKELNNLRRK